MPTKPLHSEYCQTKGTGLEDSGGLRAPIQRRSGKLMGRKLSHCKGRRRGRKPPQYHVAELPQVLPSFAPYGNKPRRKQKICSKLEVHGVALNNCCSLEFEQEKTLQMAAAVLDLPSQLLQLLLGDCEVPNGGRVEDPW